MPNEILDPSLPRRSRDSLRLAAGRNVRPEHRHHRRYGWQRQGQAAALNQQQTSDNVTNVVAADQIGRFPDANIGDAMKRIPGINVAMDQGEARFGLIRGTEPRLSSVTLNGERIPSAEGDQRNVQLDLIPADMVQLIEVNNTVTPDMDADAIGGSVNIVTRSAPPEQRILATLGSGYNMLSERGMTLGSLVVGDRFLNDNFGVVLSGSYYNHYLGSDDIEAVWNEDDNGAAYVEEFEVRKYDVQRLRRSLAGSSTIGSASTPPSRCTACTTIATTGRTGTFSVMRWTPPPMLRG